MIKAAILLSIVAVAAAQHSITFTDSGIDYTYTKDEPNLPHNSTTMACKTGVWLAYMMPDYGQIWVEIFPEIEYSCRAPFSAYTGSTRFAGLEADYALPSATLFGSRDMGGDKTVVGAEGLASISQRISSIVTVNTQVELFQEPDFGGSALCLDLNPFCENGVCWSWALYIIDYPWDITRAKSAKIGCSAGVPVVQANSGNFSTVNVFSNQHRLV